MKVSFKRMLSFNLPKSSTNLLELWRAPIMLGALPSLPAGLSSWHIAESMLHFSLPIPSWVLQSVRKLLPTLVRPGSIQRSASLFAHLQCWVVYWEPKYVGTLIAHPSQFHFPPALFRGLPACLPIFSVGLSSWHIAASALHSSLPIKGLQGSWKALKYEVAEGGG